MVYKINCNSCATSYIGLKRSVMFEHYEETEHTFDLKSPQILDAKISQYKRDFSEMLHIHFTSLTVNRKTYLNESLIENSAP